MSPGRGAGSAGTVIGAGVGALFVRRCSSACGSFGAFGSRGGGTGGVASSWGRMSASSSRWISRAWASASCVPMRRRSLMVCWS